MNKVISWVSIKNNRIVKNGAVVAEFPGIPLSELLLKSYEHFSLNYPKYYKMDRQCKLGVLACEILLRDLAQKATPTETAVVLSNKSASLDTDLRYWESTKTQASPSLFVYTLANIVAGEICIKNGFKGESVFFVSPMFNATTTVQYVNMILTTHPLNICVAGWVEMLAEDGEVFLYLTNNSSAGAIEHTPEKIAELYQSCNN